MISPIGSAAAPWLAAKTAIASRTSRKRMAITVARLLHRRFGPGPSRPPPAPPASPAGTKQLVDLGGVACREQANHLQQQDNRKNREHRDADGPQALGYDGACEAA